MVLSSAGADICIIVTTPEYSALRDADTLDRELLKLGIRDRYVVLNKVIAEMMTAGFAPRLREITNMLRPTMAGIIQFDENIQISMNLDVYKRQGMKWIKSHKLISFLLAVILLSLVVLVGSVASGGQGNPVSGLFNRVYAAIEKPFSKVAGGISDNVARCV